MKDIHAQFVRYGKEARFWLRKCSLLLPEIARQGIWREKGFGSIYEYAGKLAGMSRTMVDTALWVMKRIEDKPELLKVAEAKGLGAVRPVANIATKEDAGFWAQKANVMSKHVLETYVKDVRPGARIETVKIAMDLDPKVLDQLNKMKGTRDWNTFMKDLMSGQEKPEPVETESPYIPKEIKQYVATKTNAICAHPGCNKPATEFHHTKRFALDQKHDPDAIVGLCKAHHQLAHCGLIENEEKQPCEWKLRTEPDKSDPRYKIDQLVMNYRGS